MVVLQKHRWTALLKELGTWVKFHQILIGAMQSTFASYMQLKMHWVFHVGLLKINFTFNNRGQSILTPICFLDKFRIQY
jgi:hypothetical protein